MSENPIFPKLLRAGEVAEALQVSKTEVYRLLATGKLPGVLIGDRSVRVRPADLEIYLTQHPIPVRIHEPTR